MYADVFSHFKIHTAAVYTPANYFRRSQPQVTYFMPDSF